MSDQPKPTLSELIRNAALRDKLRVTAGATVADLNDALHQAYNDRGQPGHQRLVRNQESSISDLLRKLRDIPDEKEE